MQNKIKYINLYDVSDKNRYDIRLDNTFDALEKHAYSIQTAVFSKLKIFELELISLNIATNIIQNTNGNL
ncbi:hypothetical protein C1645_813271 [Glomus cerebriforme]|uniref:Uncharacterized protein n=1 Tax=Glomus cerebriforme TaxID=658196 RepID=A0A397TNJ6_9GLOM|nr:hypothetical protein C1645_813271 [Glomus cerebriforme]